METGTNISTKNSMMKDIQWNLPMHGWTTTVRYSTGSIQQTRAKKDSTTSLSA